MPKKRGNGDGSICQRKDGQWLAVMSYKGMDGKRHRATRYAASKAHARLLLVDMREELFGPPLPSTSDLLVGQFLQQWLKDSVEPNLAEATADSYRRAIKNHVKPSMGLMKLADLSPLHVRAWLSGLKAGNRTRQNAFVVLQSALADAQRLRIIPSNPCSPIDKPKADREEIRPFTSGESQQIITATADERLAAVYLLGLSHGPRQGEIFGLRWNDVDFQRQTVRIEQQACEVAGRVTMKALKTKSSRRSIHVSDRVAVALSDRRKASLTEGQASCDLVFPNRDGLPMRRSNFGARHWKGLLSDLGFEHRGFHHTRHTAATLMLSAGVPIHEVSRILGHARPSITLDIYSHWISTPESAGTHAADRAIFGIGG